MSTLDKPTGTAPSSSPAEDANTHDRTEAREDGQEASVSQPGRFKNDPDDASNPNEVIERHRRKLRP